MKYNILGCIKLILSFLIIMVLVSYEPTSSKVSTVALAYNLDYDKLPVFVAPVIEEVVVEEEYVPTVEKVVPPVVEEIIPPVVESVVTDPVLETFIGNLSWYGPDCYGCSGITASGHNVFTSGIYYEDATYGTVRIVAGDRSLPFGTVVRITNANLSSDPVLAVVLDRGGAIGLDKNYMFDLLFDSESSYNSVHGSTTFEILRYGY